jgi:hypothetical protein
MEECTKLLRPSLEHMISHESIEISNITVHICIKNTKIEKHSSNMPLELLVLVILVKIKSNKYKVQCGMK